MDLHLPGILRMTIKIGNELFKTSNKCSSLVIRKADKDSFAVFWDTHDYLLKTEK